MMRRLADVPAESGSRLYVLRMLAMFCIPDEEPPRWSPADHVGAQSRNRCGLAETGEPGERVERRDSRFMFK